jgi:uncharacterized membrane protein
MVKKTEAELIAEEQEEIKEIAKERNEWKKGNNGQLSITFAVISLLFLPPIFGLIGIILGIIGITKDEGTVAIVGLVLSFIFPIIGMIFGAMVWTNLF